jgi:hypothetical protein
MFTRQVSARSSVRIMFALFAVSSLSWSQIDPGPRAGAAGAGAQISGLTTKEAKFFDSGLRLPQSLAAFPVPKAASGPALIWTVAPVATSTRQ